jgi:hypothetical protein
MWADGLPSCENRRKTAFSDLKHALEEMVFQPTFSAQKNGWNLLQFPPRSAILVSIRAVAHAGSFSVFEIGRNMVLL